MKVEVPLLGEFIERHGGSPIPNPDDYFGCLLPDGARYRNGEYEIKTYEPSSDPIECCKDKKRYAALAFQQVFEDFRRMRGAIQGLVDENKMRFTFKWNVKRYGPEPEDLPTAIRTMHALVSERRDKLLTLEEELRILTRPPEIHNQPHEPGYYEQQIYDALTETRIE